MRVLWLPLLTALFFSCKKEKVDTYSDYVADNKFIHAEKDHIVDGSGNKLVLKGTIPLGWLQWEGTVWNCGLKSESDMTTAIIDVVGQSKFNSFRDSVYANFISENDIKAMADMGYNCIRVAFNHSLLEDDGNPNVYKQSGWDVLDKVISWCENYGVFVVLDLHAAPGGQSMLFISDPDKDKLWESDDNQKRTVNLWKAIASRYHDKYIIAGYDLLNEPAFMSDSKLIKLYEEIVSAIREVDPYHMLIIEGNSYATNFKRFNKAFSENMVWSFHTYDLLNNGAYKNHFDEVKKKGKKTRTPIWNSEFGANTSSWTSEVIQMFNTSDYPVSGWIFWPWKRIPADNSEKYRHLWSFQPGSNWQKLSDYIAGNGNKPTAQEGEIALIEFMNACKLASCSKDTEMEAILR